jgi:diguanylate cyclase
VKKTQFFIPIIVSIQTDDYDNVLSSLTVFPFMQALVPSETVLAWQQICQQYHLNELKLADAFISQHVDCLVLAFYEQMILLPTAAEFFDDDIVQNRLKQTLKNWLLETFRVPLQNTYITAVEQQQKVGRVHARVGIPSWLIMRGVREIYANIFKLQAQNPTENDARLNSYFIQVIGLTTEVMCCSYEENTLEKHEDKQSYRAFSAMQDVAIQKDHQRSSLLNWENDLMYKVFSGQDVRQYPVLSKSEFGLWFIHKAAYAFQGTAQVDLILQRIQDVDQLKLEQLDIDCHQQQLEIIQSIRQMNREIQNLLEQLFQMVDYLQAGNDPLTQLMSRRYLNTILAREVHYSRQNHAALALLSIDADFFKQLNDRYGHAQGDLALKLIADTLRHYTRGSDYAFRVGGEEFLLLLVDTSFAQAQIIAEDIRAHIAEQNLALANGEGIQLTVSIGCVNYDGHPDYQRFLEAADAALYQAKQQGRNRVCSQLICHTPVPEIGI